MRKRLLITLAAVLGLVAVALIGVLVWYQTGGLDRWFEAQLKAALAEMNIRAEVEGARIELRPGRVLITKLQLYTPLDAEPASAEPFASVESLTAEFSITSYFARTLDVNSLVLEHPVVNVRFDEQGRSNLAPIDLPETEGEARQQLTFLAATVTVRDGKVNYGDAVRRVDGAVDNLMVSLVPKAADTKTELNHELTVSFSESRLVYEGRELAGIGAELKAGVTNDGATVERLTLDTPAGSTTLSGTVTGWENPRYAFDVGSTISLERVGAVADPNAGLAGRASLNGRIEGQGASYTFDGRLSGDDVLVAGVRVDGVGADGRLQGERLDWTWIGRLVASRLTGFGLDVAGISFDGRLEGDGANAAAEGSLAASRVAGDGFTGEGLTFRGSADLAALSATGQVGLTSIAARTVRVGRVDAQVTATQDRVELDRFTALVYGGTVSGSARAQLAPGGASSLEAVFRGVDVDQALGAATADAPRVNGRASGTVNLTWPGTNLQAATGTIRADVDGSIPGEAGDAVPVDGEVAITAVPGRFRIDRAEFTSGESRVTATGTIGWNRRADIAVTAEAAESSDLVALLTAANPEAGRALDEYQVALGGDFRFEGNVSGLLTNPDVRGQVAIGDVSFVGESLGAFTASVERVGSGVRLSDAVVRNPDGSSIAFDLTLPTRGADPVAVTATLDRVPLARLASFARQFRPEGAAPPNGTISGKIDLRAPREGDLLAGLRGEVDVSVAGATFNGDEVSDLRIRTTIGEDLIEVPDLRLATARGAVTGSIVYDKRTNEYRASLEGDDVDLSLLSGAQEGLALSGRASGTAEATGTLRVSLSPLRYENRVAALRADVAGTDVVLNGQEVGDPRLTVDSAGEVANVRLAADVLGERRELAGTIRLTETLPFEFAVPLENTNLAPYAALAGQEVPQGLTTDVTGTLRVSGELQPSDAESIADSLEVAANFTEFSVSAPLEGTDRTYTLASRDGVSVVRTGDVLRVERSTFTGEGTELTVEGAVALAPEAASNLTISGDVNLALVGSFAPDVYAGGVANVQATIAGTLANPRSSGFADIRDASLRVVGMPVGITNGNGRVIFSGNQALVESFTAQANGGRVSVDGGVLFAGARPARWRFGIDAEQVRVTYPEDVRSIVDGDLQLQGNPQLQVLSGLVNLRRAEYTRDVELTDLLDLDRTPQTDGFGAGTAGGDASPLRLDLRVEARDSLIVRNNLADAVASASLVVTGPANDPVIEGRATVTRGTINFRNDEYQISRGVVRFPGRVGEITFDLQAETDIRGYRVTVGMTGTPDRPVPVLRSEPPLPETQIASLILTGELGSDEVTTSTLAQSGVGLAGSLLSSAVSESVERRTSRLFGINRFQISPVLGSSDPSARVTLGRQINKNLAISYTVDVTSTNEQIIQVEYRISDRFSVVATRDEDGAFGIDFRIRKRF